jgi:hypothetical protein
VGIDCCEKHEATGTDDCEALLKDCPILQGAMIYKAHYGADLKHCLATIVPKKA